MATAWGMYVVAHYGDWLIGSDTSAVVVAPITGKTLLVASDSMLCGLCALAATLIYLHWDRAQIILFVVTFVKGISLLVSLAAFWGTSWRFVLFPSPNHFSAMGIVLFSAAQMVSLVGASMLASESN